MLIPAYNEEHRLPHTIDRTIALLERRPWRSRVVVIDNGSVDATPDVIDRGRSSTVDLQVVGCAAPGKGAAVRLGILTSSARYVGYMDADLATPVETLDVAVARMEGGADVVIGSRRAPGATYEVTPTVVRRLGTRAFRALTRRLVPGIGDTQCGFKFFRNGSAQLLLQQVQTPGFAFDVEVLARAHRAGLRVDEVPVAWTSMEGSKFSPLRDGLPSFVAAARLFPLLRQTPTRTAH